MLLANARPSNIDFYLSVFRAGGVRKDTAKHALGKSSYTEELYEVRNRTVLLLCETGKGPVRDRTALGLGGCDFSSETWKLQNPKRHEGKFP